MNPLVCRKKRHDDHVEDKKIKGKIRSESMMQALL
jgi:hypothetical protein